MRQSSFLLPTSRDIPSDAEAVSHQLMLRSGMIRQLAAGIYTLLPLGQRVMNKIQAIVREEMDCAGAQELLMPALHPAELWKASGRWDVYGSELMRLHDRHDREFALGATHEEVITSLIRDEVHSYKKLPMTLYQIQTKFRDERRPRFGVLRSREFLMKDAYSFDASEEGLNTSFQRMFDAYCSIFERCGLNFRAVEADSGAIGGTGSLEFMVLSDIGEDTIVHCSQCSYAANLEKAEILPQALETQIVLQSSSMTLVETPNVKTIEQLTAFFAIRPEQIIKAVAFQVDQLTVLALVRGDYEINETKVKQLFVANTIELLAEQRIVEQLSSVPGFIGPVDVMSSIIVIADHSIRGMSGVAGANQENKHFMNVMAGRDFEPTRYCDIRDMIETDPCPRCGGQICIAKGIEVGHVFKIGTKYSKRFGATFQDKFGQTQPMIMGTYGIGITRMLAAIVEQHHDSKGIVWPMPVAPFHIHLLIMNSNDEHQIKLGEQIYEKLLALGFEVLFDDRFERPGVKFTDSELIGIPIRITVGKKAADQVVEYKLRKTEEMIELMVDELYQIVAQYRNIARGKQYERS